MDKKEYVTNFFQRNNSLTGSMYSNPYYVINLL